MKAHALLVTLAALLLACDISPEPIDAGEEDVPDVADTSADIDTGTDTDIEEEPAPVCGDGLVDAGEACDSDVGDTTCATLGFVGGTLACSDTCELDTSGCHQCGDLVVDDGEACDGRVPEEQTCATPEDPLLVGALACTSDCLIDRTDCHLPGCGDGVVEGDEACDDGNLTAGDGCSDTCVIEYCGDGTVQAGLDEQCDPGAGALACTDFGFVEGDAGCTDACALDLSACVAAICGDGETTGDERCDDGNLTAGDGCSPRCQIEFCIPGHDVDGDGVDDCDDVETCDGLDNDGDGVVDNHPTDDELGAPCYDGDESTAGVGTCAPGVLACRNGALTCVGAITPQPERCNGRDDNCDGAVPAEEATCAQVVSLASAPVEATFDVVLPTPPVDVVFSLDASRSMGGELRALSEAMTSTLAPRLETAFGDVAYGMVTFQDFPVAPFGDPADLPAQVVSRVTTDLGSVTDAIAATTVVGGGDRPESGLEALARIFLGSDARWPASPRTDVLGPWTAGHFRPGAPDTYTFTLGERGLVELEVFARRGGSTLDPLIALIDLEDGHVIARSDDALGLDSLLATTLHPGDYAVQVSSCCGGAPDWGDTEGWYGLSVRVNGVPHLPVGGTCRLADGEETATETLLVPVFDVWPYTLDLCYEDCASTHDYPADLVRGFCGDGSPYTLCGDGRLGYGESCDDGNSDAGDGCDAQCQSEYASTGVLDPLEGFSSSMGHGARGGIGFRDGAFPIVVHITDDLSHEATDYADMGIEAHGTEAIFEAADRLGARVVGVASGSRARGEDPNDPRHLWGMTALTESTVPLCAFDESAARADERCAEDACCTGLDGAGTASVDGACPLVFDVATDGTGLGEVVVEAVENLVRYGGEAITFGVESSTPEAICLVAALEVVADDPSGCAPPVQLADADDDGLLESVAHATPGVRLSYTVRLDATDRDDLDGDGDTAEACVAPGTYALTLTGRTVDGFLRVEEPLEVTVEPR